MTRRSPQTPENGRLLAWSCVLPPRVLGATVLLPGLLGGLLSGCAGDCEDDGFGQADLGADCPVSASGQIDAEDGSGTDSPSSGTNAPTTSGASETGTDPQATTSATTTGDESSSGEPPITATWCEDADQDTFGNPLACTPVPEGESPPRGWVLDDTDCDDTSDQTFVGAAAQEDPRACSKDVDLDGFGDATPPAGVDAGADCLDDDDAVYPGVATEEPELCTADADADGYGDAQAPEGVDPGSDCLDDDADTFPGAADIDDLRACMRDADDDGYGDSMPPAGATAGTDCDDADVAVPVANACLVWCLDADDDQYGDPDACVITPTAPDMHVGNDADCDDAAADTFPGAAPGDDAEACMKDTDDDDRGDETPAVAGVVAGSDCDDLEVLVQSACFDCPADTTYCDGNNDISQCNAQGTFGSTLEACGWGCDDDAIACWPELTVNATASGMTCFDADADTAVALQATAAGGDGTYAYAWTPAAAVTDPTSDLTQATPASTSSYVVTVTDDENNQASDAVTVHVTDEVRDLGGPGCAAYAYADIYGDPDPQPSSVNLFSGDAVYCNLTPNSAPTAYVCPQVMEDARVSWQMQVVSATDDDGLGFVWGWQDPGHFYVLLWKQTSQPTAWGSWNEGITIKRIHADDPAALTGPDLAGGFDTEFSTVLATPAEFHPTGWQDNNEYAVELELSGADTVITIRRFDDNSLVASGTVSDDSYPAGAVGSFEASQGGACNGFWSSSCL